MRWGASGRYLIEGILLQSTGVKKKWFNAHGLHLQDKEMHDSRDSVLVIDLELI